MKICLIRPPRLMVKGTKPVSEHPPFGLAILAGILKQDNHEVIVVDGIIESPKQFNSIKLSIRTQNPDALVNLMSMGLTRDEILNRVPGDVDLIGFSCMFSTNWPLDRDLIDYIGSKRKNAICIAGGESITSMSQTCLEQAKNLSICILGEGEETLTDLVSSIAIKNKPLNEVKGISFKLDGEVVFTPKRSRLKTLEAIPIAPWELFHVDKYQRHHTRSTDTEGRITLPILATRGCPYRCTFCTSPDMWGTRYYMRSPEHVINEIEFLINKFGASNFEFYDLTAIIKKQWIIDFTKIAEEKQLDFTWKIPAGTRSEAIDSEVAKQLYMSGCYSITYAPESGSKRLLKIIKKKVVLKNMLRSIKQTRNEGIHIRINMILGLPDEKHLDVIKTAWFLVKSVWAGVEDMSLHVYRPYPGSKLFELLVEEEKIDITNDDFLLEALINIDNPWESTFFNDNISRNTYKLYHAFLWFTFYSSVFLFEPKKLIKSLKNIINNKSESLFERKVLQQLSNYKFQLRQIRNSIIP